MLLQTADSFGHSAKGQHWRSAGLTDLVCAEVEHTQKGVSVLLCDVLSKHICYVNTRIIFVGRFRCSCCVLQAHFPSIAADRQTHTHQGSVLCVSVTQPYFGLLH